MLFLIFVKKITLILFVWYLNSDHLSQPLHVPMLHQSVVQSFENLNPCQRTISKDSFPVLLKQLVTCLSSENLISGLKICGIFSLDPQQLLKNFLMNHSLMWWCFKNTVSSVVAEQLIAMQGTKYTKKEPHRKKVCV